MSDEPHPPTAEKRRPGRPTKYRPAYCAQVIAYFKRCAASSNKLAMLTDFSTSVGVCIDTVDNWQTAHPEFFRAVKTAMRYQEAQLCQRVLAGKWNPAASIFLLKNNHGYRDHDREAPPVAVHIHYGHAEQPTVRVFQPIETNGDG